MIFNKV